MDAIFNTVLPVFGMIVLGYGFARANIVDAIAARGIAQFVFNVAIPALLFRTVAVMAAQEAAPSRGHFTTMALLARCTSTRMSGAACAQGPDAASSSVTGTNA